MQRKNFTFKNPQLFSALAAYLFAQKGHNVFIEIPYAFDSTFRYEYTDYYPEKLTDIVTSKLNYRFLNQLASFFPHLVFRQRVYTFSTEIEWSAKYLNTADKLLNYDREMASFPANPSTYLKSECKQLKKGAQVIEYRFDRQQAIFELITMAKEQGAKIIQSATKDISPTEIFSKKPNLIYHTFQQQKLPTNNPIRIKSPAFNLSLNNSFNNIELIIEAHLPDYAEKLAPILNKFDLSLEDLNVTLEDGLNIETDGFKFQESSLLQLRKNWNTETNRMLKQFSFSRSNLALPKPQNSLAEQYKNLPIACEDCFDIAKQTGIEFRSFEKLYYRYQPFIETMIDNAYDKMAIERNPEIIWNRVEEEHLQKIWKKLLD